MGLVRVVVILGLSVFDLVVPPMLLHLEELVVGKEEGDMTDGVNNHRHLIIITPQVVLKSFMVKVVMEKVIDPLILEKGAKGAGI